MFNRAVKVMCAVLAFDPEEIMYRFYREKADTIEAGIAAAFASRRTENGSWR